MGYASEAERTATSRRDRTGQASGGQGLERPHAGDRVLVERGYLGPSWTRSARSGRADITGSTHDQERERASRTLPVARSGHWWSRSGSRLTLTWDDPPRGGVAGADPASPARRGPGMEEEQRLGRLLGRPKADKGTRTSHRDRRRHLVPEYEAHRAAVPLRAGATRTRSSTRMSCWPPVLGDRIQAAGSWGVGRWRYARPVRVTDEEEMAVVLADPELYRSSAAACRRRTS